ncbi:LysR family transcriptional regulator [Agrobacterium vitis]
MEQAPVTPAADELGLHAMTLRELRIFLTICETRTFSKAATRLGISQPGLSRAVRDMEERFEMRFFERNGRGVDLTPAGQVLRHHAETVINTLKDLENDLEELREDIRGSVSVLLPTHVSQAVTPALIKTFASSYPRATIHVFEDSNERIAERVKAGEADFGLFYDINDEVSNRVAAVATEELYLVTLPDEQEYRKGQRLTWSDISRVPLVLPRVKSPYRQFLEKAAARCEVKLNVVRELEMGSTLLAFVIEREGATILPRGQFHREETSGLVAGHRIDASEVMRWIKVIRSASSPRKVVKFSIATLIDEVRRHNEIFNWNLNT